MATEPELARRGADDTAVDGAPVGDAGSGGDARVDGDAGSGDDAGALVSRTRVIEEQPIDERAAAFAMLHDELRTRLEGGGGAGV